jgi:hypothetical protein
MQEPACQPCEYAYECPKQIVFNSVLMVERKAPDDDYCLGISDIAKTDAHGLSGTPCICERRHLHLLPLGIFSEYGRHGVEEMCKLDGFSSPSFCNPNYLIP